MNNRMQELVGRTRTVRRYQEEKPLDRQILIQMIECARLSGSARNSQVLKYRIVTDAPQREMLFPLLGWAGYLSDWRGPGKGERPSAYILCLLDKSLLKGPEHEAHFDLGVATQSMLLCAAEYGVFGCRIGSYSKNIDRVMGISSPCSVLLVLALGYPAEQVVLEQADKNGDIRYWRDESGTHHVPKRALDDLIIS